MKQYLVMYLTKVTVKDFKGKCRIYILVSKALVFFSFLSSPKDVFFIAVRREGERERNTEVREKH